MTHLIDATLEIGYFDARPARGEIPARASFHDAGMTLEVKAGESGETSLYHGEQRGQGHYVLTGPDTGAGATLHRFAGSTILEGFWRSAGDRGFWRLHLPAESVQQPHLRAEKETARSRSQRGSATAPKSGPRRTAPRSYRANPNPRAA